MGKKLTQTSLTRTAQILGRFTACSHMATSQAFSRWKAAPVKWDVEKWESGSSRTLSLSRLSIGLVQTVSSATFCVDAKNPRQWSPRILECVISLRRPSESSYIKNKPWKLVVELRGLTPPWWTRSKKPSKPRTLPGWLPWNRNSSQDVKNTQE